MGQLRKVTCSFFSLFIEKVLKFAEQVMPKGYPHIREVFLR